MLEKEITLEILLLIKLFRMEVEMATGRCAMIAVDTDLTRIEIGPEKNYLRKKKPIEERKLPLPNRLIISFAHMSSLPITVV